MSDHCFQVSVKGVFFKDNKIMMIQENTGKWELPGGRVKKGEGLIETLQREVKEETGLGCKVLELQPFIVYSTLDEEGDTRIMIFYRIHIDNLEFKPSEECIAIKFYSKGEIKTLQTVRQIKQLPYYL